MVLEVFSEYLIRNDTIRLLHEYQAVISVWCNNPHSLYQTEHTLRDKDYFSYESIQEHTIKIDPR
jgi:hypothetical protein